MIFLLETDTAQSYSELNPLRMSLPTVPLPQVTSKKRKRPDGTVDTSISLTGASPDTHGSQTDINLERARKQAAGMTTNGRRSAADINATASSPPSVSLSPSSGTGTKSQRHVKINESHNQTQIIPCRAASGRPQVAVSCGTIVSNVGCPLCKCVFNGPTVRDYIDGICNVNGPSEIIADIIKKAALPLVDRPTLIDDFVAQYLQFKTNLCNSSICIVDADGKSNAATPEQIKLINDLLDALYTQVWSHLKGRHLAPAGAQ